MKKILIITWCPFTDSHFENYDLYELSKNFDITIYDITLVLFKRITPKNLIKKKIPKYTKIKYISFFNLKKLIHSIKTVEPNLVINNTDLKNNHIIIKEILRKKHTKLLSIFNYSWTEGIDLFPKNIFYSIKYFINKIIFYFNKKNDNDIAIISGNNLLNKLSSLGKKKYYHHSFAYNFFLKNCKKKTKLKFKRKKKIVSYVDSGFGFHPDFLLNKNLNKNFDKKSYIKKVNIFFLKLKKAGYKTYFLAHPKVKINHHKLFKNCEIIYNRTFDYISLSDIVMFTSSSAIDFAILYKKKLLNLFSSEIKVYPANYKAIQYFSRKFNHLFLNLDKIEHEINVDKTINEKLLHPNSEYDRYINNYVRHPNSKNSKLSELVTKIILN